MPGRSGYEAVSSYLEPIRRVVGLLSTHPTIIKGRGQRYDVGSEGYWRLGAEDGLQLKMPGGSTGYFSAEQRYKIIEVPPGQPVPDDGKFRVTTLMYAYELKLNGLAVWQMHWHPQGNSPETRPHYHFDATPGSHNPCARHTIEDAVEWCIEAGAVPTRPDWQRVLYEAKDLHEQHRSWTDKPTPPA